MSKRKFGFDGFGINRPVAYNFERTPAAQRLYVPPSSRAGAGGDNHEDADLDNIEYEQTDAADRPTLGGSGGDDGDVDPLDAFMEGIQEEIRAPPPASAKPKDRGDKYDGEDEDDPVESFLRSKKDAGLTLGVRGLSRWV